MTPCTNSFVKPISVGRINVSAAENSPTMSCSTFASRTGCGNGGPDGCCLAVGHVSAVSNNNIFQDGCAYSNDGESSVMVLSTWKNNYDSNSIESTVNTVLNNVSSDDYSLASGSPGINFGVSSLSGVQISANDIESTARPQTSSVDVGAYEYP